MRNLDGLELNGRTMRVKAADNFDQRYRTGGEQQAQGTGVGGAGQRAAATSRDRVSSTAVTCMRVQLTLQQMR